MECGGLSQPLFVIQGLCLGMEINLDTNAIPFGAVVQRSQTSRKIVMSNTGDMNAKYDLALSSTSLTLAKWGLMHVRKVASQISLYSHRLIWDDTFRFYGNLS